MPFSLEAIEDFDQTIFSYGAGWAIVSEIHLGIMTRAKACGHAALIAAYPTQMSGLLWLEEGYAPARPELKSKLNDLYNDVVALVSGQSNLRWTESSGRSPEWTTESLTSDIGMGDFEDLLVKPQRPEPIVWLVAALNRLRHPKITRSVALDVINPGELASKSEIGSTSGGDTPDSVWDELIVKPMGYTNTSYDRVEWAAASVGAGSFGYSETYSSSGITTQEVELQITTIANDYRCLVQASWYTGPDLYVTIGSSDPSNMGSANSLITQKTVEATEVDIEARGGASVAITIATEMPDSPPFNGFWPLPFTGSIDAKYGFIRVIVQSVIFYCDLPDVMGAGELDAPVPTVSGDNE